MELIKKTQSQVVATLDINENEGALITYALEQINTLDYAYDRPEEAQELLRNLIAQFRQVFESEEI